MADNPHIIDDGFSEPEQARKIFVGNLPYEADEGTGRKCIFTLINPLEIVNCLASLRHSFSLQIFFAKLHKTVAIDAKTHLSAWPRNAERSFFAVWGNC